MTMQPSPDACPLCGGANACAQEIERATGQPQPPCWCTRATFTAALLARVPEAARRKACICAGCAAAAASAAVDATAAAAVDAAAAAADAQAAPPLSAAPASPSGNPASRSA